MRPILFAFAAALILAAGIGTVIVFLVLSGDGGARGGAVPSALQGGGEAVEAAGAGTAGLPAAGRSAGGSELRPLRHPANGRPGESDGPEGRARRGAPGAAGARTGAGTDDPLAAPALPRGTGELIFEVQNGASEPVAGVTITLFASGSSGRGALQAVTGGEGAASFAGLGAAAYTYRVRGSGLPDLAGARAVALGEGERRTVRLRIGAFDLSIAGRVLDSAGAAVEGITVTARKQTFGAGDEDLVLSGEGSLQAVSGPDGAYEVAGLDAADYVLATLPTPEHSTTRKVVRAGTRSADLVLGSLRELAIQGTVTGRDGAPIEGALVMPLGQPERQARSGPEGRYQTLIELREEQRVYVLSAGREGYREERVNVQLDDVRAGESWQVDFVLDALGESAPVAGIVIDSSRNPVAGESVFFHSASLNARYQAVSDARGEFSIGAVQVGKDYNVWVHPSSGYRDFSRSPVLVPENGLDIEIVLEPIGSGSLRGSMIDPAGAPVPNFTLWLRSLKALGNSISVTGDAAGRFEAEGVPEGDLIFETRSIPNFTVSGIQLRAGEEQQVALVLDWGRQAFSGSVVDERGAPVARAAVTLQWAHSAGALRSASLRSAATDAGGRFTFSELAAGEHRISVSSPVHEEAQATFDVGSGSAGPIIRVREKPAGGR